MALLFLYFFFLFISPQDWLQPFVGLRTDLLVLPLWLGWAVLTGRAPELARLRHQDWFFAAMLAWLYLNPVVNGTNDMTGTILFNYTKWFVVYRLIVVTLPAIRSVRRALLMLLLFGLVLSVEGIQHFHNPEGLGWAGQPLGWVTLEAQAAGVGGRTQWVSMFNGPGVFCVVYTICVPVAMHFMDKAFRLPVRLLGLACTATLLVATFYTGSRGGFLATIGILGIYAAVKIGVTPTRVAAAAVAMALAFVAAPEHLTSTKDSHRSAQHRIDVWAFGIEMVRNHSIFGVGKGNYARYTGKLIAHNSLIEITAETGIPGSFLWLGLIYMAFKNLVIGYRRSEDGQDRAALLALALGIAGYLMSALFVTLEYETLYILLAMASAVGVARGDPARFAWRDAAMLAGAMVALAFGIKVVVATYY